MSAPIYDIDEALWEQYVTDCQVAQITPGIKDYLIWCDEHDMDRPEVYDGGFNSED